MATNKRPWTRHKIRDSALRQLAAAVNRPDGSLYPGIGYGAPSSRSALMARGLAEEITRPSNQYRGTHDVVITPLGELALIEARAEGW
jgi:hypothetical protein